MENQLVSQDMLSPAADAPEMKHEGSDNNEKSAAFEFQSEFGLDPEAMYKAGVHLGHRVSRLHPKMKPYVFGIKNTIHIVDLEKTVQKLEEALRVIAELKKKNGVILFAVTSPQHLAAAENLLSATGMPYVVNRWLGGTLTNFSVMHKRIQYIKDLEQKQKSDDFLKYTKKERFDIEKEIKELNEKFGGFKNLEKLPDLVFVIDLKRDALAVREARRMGIPTMGIADTNVDPTAVDYPIPANDDSIPAVEYILKKVVEVLR